MVKNQNSKKKKKECWASKAVEVSEQLTLTPNQRHVVDFRISKWQSPGQPLCPMDVLMKQKGSGTMFHNPVNLYDYVTLDPIQQNCGWKKMLRSSAPDPLGPRPPRPQTPLSFLDLRAGVQCTFSCLSYSNASDNKNLQSRTPSDVIDICNLYRAPPGLAWNDSASGS